MRVLVITGAGISAESGIPTFRGKDGYWRNLDPSKLATPEAFARDPELVWEWYRERRQRIRQAKPNTAHNAIARLAQQSDDLLLLTGQQLRLVKPFVWVSPDMDASGPVRGELVECGRISALQGIGQGYTLFTPMYGDGIVYLIDMAGEVVHTWRMPHRPGLYGYLLDKRRSAFALP